MVAAVEAMPVEDDDGGETVLAVGVGVATGEAFVGNIQAVDRMIWTAIGNTVNLAARLESLTRDLDASLVIDAATRERAQPAAADFEKHPNVTIRGSRTRVWCRPRWKRSPRTCAERINCTGRTSRM
jgi:class 3 adenylate cyclase